MSTDLVVRQVEPHQEEPPHVHHLYSVTCVEHDLLTKRPEKCRVQPKSYYLIPVHRQGPCRNVRRDPKVLSASESHGETVVSIPRHSQITHSDVEQVVLAINSRTAA